jgi:aspartyl-tRNA(Asn)/glutamyl-tRNA(Gln) amidotransferase subunit B
MAYSIEGRTGAWEVVIGLEVHAQVISKAKLFSGAATNFGAEPNTQVSFVDAAFPGMLPVINAACVEQAVRTGLGLNAEINLVSRFDRKNYFYADLPQGYQISQYEHPIVGKGVVEIELADGSTRQIGVTRLHLEQDAGKSLHDQHPTKSYIDLNRSGVGLMEIVSEPDLRSPEETGAYLRKLRAILRYLGTCDGNMEEGSMRADVNVSVRKAGEPYRTRCEVKNVNSVRFVMQAVEAEAARQVEVWESGGEVVQETRLFDPARGETRPMRSKEDAHDYRYFPDPDLLPLVLEAGWVAGLRAALPELPDEKRARFMREFGLSAYSASVIVDDMPRAKFFEELVRKGLPPEPAANAVIGTIPARLKELGLTFDDVISSDHAAFLEQTVQVLSAQVLKIISGTSANVLMLQMGGETTVAHIEALIEKNTQVTDTGAIDAACAAVLAANPDKVTEFRAGKDKLFGFFVGQVMKAMAGKGNPALVNEALQKLLSA